MNVVTKILLEYKLISKIMATSMFEAFKKYILFQEDFLFKISLYFIFNEENHIETISGKLKFVLTYEKF